MKTREIKFRAWSKLDKVLLDVMNIDFNMAIVTVRDIMGPANIKLRDCVLEQYTGLKDKNGKKIYEGDILKYYVDGRKKYEYLVVKYQQEGACFITGWVRVDYATRMGEVVGNIHENANLLEVPE